MVLDIPGLPSLSDGEEYLCFFEEIQSALIVQETSVTCFTPPAHMVPPVPHGQGRTLSQYSSVLCSSSEVRCRISIDICNSHFMFKLYLFMFFLSPFKIVNLLGLWTLEQLIHAF